MIIWAFNKPSNGFTTRPPPAQVNSTKSDDDKNVVSVDYCGYEIPNLELTAGDGRQLGTYKSYAIGEAVVIQLTSHTKKRAIVMNDDIELSDEWSKKGKLGIICVKLVDDPSFETDVPVDRVLDGSMWNRFEPGQRATLRLPIVMPTPTQSTAQAPASAPGPAQGQGQGHSQGQGQGQAQAHLYSSASDTSLKPYRNNEWTPPAANAVRNKTLLADLPCVVTAVLLDMTYAVEVVLPDPHGTHVLTHVQEWCLAVANADANTSEAKGAEEEKEEKEEKEAIAELKLDDVYARCATDKNGLPVSNILEGIVTALARARDLSDGMGTSTAPFGNSTELSIAPSFSFGLTKRRNAIDATSLEDWKQSGNGTYPGAVVMVRMPGCMDSVGHVVDTLSPTIDLRDKLIGKTFAWCTKASERLTAHSNRIKFGADDEIVSGAGEPNTHPSEGFWCAEGSNRVRYSGNFGHYQLYFNDDLDAFVTSTPDVWGFIVDHRGFETISDERINRPTSSKINKPPPPVSVISPIGDGDHVTFFEFEPKYYPGTTSLRGRPLYSVDIPLYQGAKWDQGIVVAEENKDGMVDVEVEVEGEYRKRVLVPKSDLLSDPCPGDEVEVTLTDFISATTSHLGVEGSPTMPMVGVAVGEGGYERLELSMSILKPSVESTASVVPKSATTKGSSVVPAKLPSVGEPSGVGRPSSEVVPRFHGPQRARVVKSDTKCGKVTVVVLDRESGADMFCCEVSSSQLLSHTKGSVVRHKYGTKWRPVSTVSEVDEYEGKFSFKIGDNDTITCPAASELKGFESGTLVDVQPLPSRDQAGPGQQGLGYGCGVIVGAPAADGTYTVKFVHEKLMQPGIAFERVSRRTRRVEPMSRVHCTVDGQPFEGIVKWVWPDGTCTVVAADSAKSPNSTFHALDAALALDLDLVSGGGGSGGGRGGGAGNGGALVPVSSAGDRSGHGQDLALWSVHTMDSR